MDPGLPERRDPVTAAEDMVRTELYEGVAPEQIALRVSNRTGVAVEQVQAFVDAHLAAEAAVQKKRTKRWWIIGGVGVVVGFGLDQWLGTSRGIGTVLLLLACGVSLAMFGWLVSQLRNL